MPLRAPHVCLLLLGAILLCLAFIGFGVQGMLGLLALVGAVGALVMGWLTVRDLLREANRATPP